MLDLMVEIAAFILVLFFLVPFLFFSFWLHHISEKEHPGQWHEDDTARSAPHQVNEY